MSFDKRLSCRTYKNIRLIMPGHSGRDPVIWFVSKSLQIGSESMTAIECNLRITSKLSINCGREEVKQTHMTERFFSWDQFGKVPLIRLLNKYLRSIDE